MLDAEGKVHILGRRSGLINVGGEKVHPTEIENVLLQIDNVKDVTVRGHPNPITGEVVAAKISTVVPEDTEALKRRVRQFCHARLERYKMPPSSTWSWRIIEPSRGSHRPRARRERMARSVHAHQR